MNLMGLSELIGDPVRVREYLKKRGLLEEYISCIYCSSGHIGPIRRDTYKCYQCRREWSGRGKGYVSRFRIPWDKLLMLIKLFEIEVPA